MPAELSQKIQSSGLNILSNTMSSSAATKPITDEKNKKNEIFVDVIEKLSVLFNSSGYTINTMIEGCIQMKCYLHGNPQLKLALNEDIQIANSYSHGILLDDCNFHESVNTNEFDLNKILKINPPSGEFIAMNYRINSDF